MKYVKVNYDRSTWPPSKWDSNLEYQLEFVRASSVVCDDPKFIFIHIGRTGGVSMHRKIFEKKFPDSNNSPNWDKSVNDEKWKDYFKFTFVRNPWGKMVSAYHLDHRSWHVPLNTIPKDVTFEYFLKNIAWDENGDPRNTHWVKHYKFIENIQDPTERWIDFIGRFENINDDWKIVCEKIGINEPLPYANKNQNKPKADYRTYYNDETIEIVRKKFERDIELFDYSFE